jgi:alanyl-tRNA synthetase
MLSSEVARRCLDWFGAPGPPAPSGAGLLTTGPLASVRHSGIDPLQGDGGPARQVASIQRCLRPEDMRIVGRTGQHGTFFQMVTAVATGNDVTADLARAAWTLTTDPVTSGGLGIAADRLHVVVASEEIAGLWTSAVGLEESQLVRPDSSDQTTTQQAGEATVLSDIVLDRGVDDECDPTPGDREDVRLLPLWSLHRSADGYTTAVGLGVERIAMALQLVATFCDTDQVRPVLDRIALLTGTPYDGTEPGSIDGVRLRVAADHVRTALMLADAGVMPADGELGLVMERVVRRTAHALRLLGFDDPALAELLPIARDLMAPAYPSVAERYDHIAAVLVDVEATFRGSLPPRTAGRGSATAASGSEHTMLVGVRNEFGPTDSLAYETLQATAHVVAIISEDQNVEVAAAGATVDVVLDCTPFFAQRCGQASDRGTLYADGLAATVTDARWAVPELVVHRVHVDDGELRVGADVTAEVDADLRLASCQAHSAAHVLQAALRDELGEAAIRLASADEPGRAVLELDGTLPWSADIADIVEDIANDALRGDLTVTTRTMRLDEALFSGALHAHSSTSTDTVRVVEIDGEWSREICDGTHVLHTSQIGLITLGDSGVTTSGRLRIEALCGRAGLLQLHDDRDLVRALSATARVTREQLMTLIAQLDTADMQTIDLTGDTDVPGAHADADEAAAAP